VLEIGAMYAAASLVNARVHLLVLRTLRMLRA
jgi:hypothetical protein